MHIFWFLCGNEKNPSSRIHGINVHRKLVELGYSSQILYMPYRFMHDLYYSNTVIKLMAGRITRDDVAIIQKLRGPKTQKLMKLLKKRGVRIIFIDCDLPLKPEVARLADVVLCPSLALCNLYFAAGMKEVLHINDAVEMFIPPLTQQKERKQITWFGKSGLGKWNAVTWFQTTILPRLGDKWEFITVSDHPEATHPWSVETAWSIINRADLSVIPVPSEEADLVKSANRCTQSLALGVPVLCHRLPAYTEVVQDHVNGLVSNAEDEWVTFIRGIEDDHVLKQMKQNAFDTSKQFSIDVIIEQWISALKLEKLRTSTSTVLLSMVFWLHVKYYVVRRWMYRKIGF